MGSPSIETGRVIHLDGPDELLKAAQTALLEQPTTDLVVLHNAGAIALIERESEPKAWLNHVRNTLQEPVQELWRKEHKDPADYGGFRPVRTMYYLEREGGIPWHIDGSIGPVTVEGPLTLSTRTDSDKTLRRIFSVCRLSEPSLDSRGYYPASQREEVNTLSKGNPERPVTSVEQEPDTVIFMHNHPYAMAHHVADAGQAASGDAGHTSSIITSFLLEQPY